MSRLRDSVEQVQECLNALTDYQQKLMIMRYFRRLSHQEIANQLGVSRQTVGRHMSNLINDLICIEIDMKGIANEIHQHVPTPAVLQRPTLGIRASKHVQGPPH